LAGIRPNRQYPTAVRIGLPKQRVYLPMTPFVVDVYKQKIFSGRILRLRIAKSSRRI
jgi:hypothetical protein